jgi:hypothetical protein
VLLPVPTDRDRVALRTARPHARRRPDLHDDLGAGAVSNTSLRRRPTGCTVTWRLRRLEKEVGSPYGVCLCRERSELQP